MVPFSGCTVVGLLRDESTGSQAQKYFPLRLIRAVKLSGEDTMSPVDREKLEQVRL